MPLFPVPVILAIFIWIFIFRSTDKLMLYGVGVALLGVIAFLLKSYLRKEWPFAIGADENVNTLLNNNPDIKSNEQKKNL